MAYSFRRSAAWLVVAMALGLPRGVAAQTFTLTVNLVNTSTVNSVNVIDIATASVIGRCSTLSPSATCIINVNAGATLRVAAAATGGGSSPVPSRLSAGTGPAAACALSSCAFTMTSDASLTATFIADGSPMSTITTTITGDAPGRILVGGEPCDRTSLSGPLVCSLSYLTGSLVWLDAETRPASRFAGYSAGTGPASVCGTASGCEMTLGSAATVTATFVSMTTMSVTPTSAIGTLVGPPTVFQAIGTYTDASTQPIQPGAGEWHGVTAPISNPGHRAAAVINGKIYLAGGNDGFSDASVVETYDPVGNAWTALAPMPTTRSSLAGAAAGGQFYAIGGRAFNFSTSTETVFATVESYDPVTNTWSTRAPMPSARKGVAAGVVNGIIYAVGGTDAGGTIVSTVEAYDPATNTWTSRAPLPSPRTGAVVDVYDGILYAVGGGNAGGAVSTLEAYDPSANTWSAKAPVPAPMAGYGAFVDGVLYFTGGVFSTYAYDPVANVWSSRSRPGIWHVGGPSGVGLNGVFYLVGAYRVVGGFVVHAQTAEAFTDSLRWSLGTPAVARIAQSGSVTGRAPGTTSVIATVGSQTCAASCGSFSVLGPSLLGLNGPLNRSVLPAPFTVVGWALNPNMPAGTGTGVDAVHVYADPMNGNAAIFLGAATYGLARPDVGAVFGSQFTNSGFSLTAGDSLAPGPYTLLVYAHNAFTGGFDALTTSTIQVQAPVTNPFIDLDTPREGTVTTSAFEVVGWTLDAGSPTGTGVDAVQFYVFPNNGNDPGVFIGQGSYGLSRPDVAALFGSRFTNTGFHFSISGLSPGAYVLGVYAHSTVTSGFTIVKLIHFTVNATALLAVSPPAAEAIIAAPVFDVDGWSIDRAIESTAIAGSGVDTLHVYAYPEGGGGPIFLGVATVGLSRPDVAALYGSRYDTSGFHLAVDRSALGLTPGVYKIAVHSHSTVTNTFNNVAVVRVTLR